MKQPFCLALALLVPLVGLSGCSGNADYLEKPADTNLDFWITQKVTWEDFSTYEAHGGMFGGELFYSKGSTPIRDSDHCVIKEPEVYVLYQVTAYPDYSDATTAVTAITIVDPAIHFYGISLSSSYAEFDQAVRAKGFTIHEENGAHYGTKGRLAFGFNPGKNISLYAAVDNRNKICF